MGHMEQKQVVTEEAHTFHLVDILDQFMSQSLSCMVLQYTTTITHCSVCKRAWLDSEMYLYDVLCESKSQSSPILFVTYQLCARCCFKNVLPSYLFVSPVNDHMLSLDSLYHRYICGEKEKVNLKLG